MIGVDLRALTQPVGILRVTAAILTCISFSLVASVGYVTNSYWSWCMFTWCFCFVVTLAIVIMEFTTMHSKAPFGWEDFTAAFAMLASLMIFTASIIYPSFFTCKGVTPSGPKCHRQIGASVLSWVCLLVYVGEVVLTRLRPQGEIIGFLSTVPGIMKMLETFIACIIFTSMDKSQFRRPELQWCVSVYSLCFIFAVVIIVICTAQLTSYSPIAFEKVVIVYNIMATVMYVSAMVLWPLYSFQKNPKPPNCGFLCPWDKLVVITIMTIFNTIVYILDSAYSIFLVFFVGRE